MTNKTALLLLAITLGACSQNNSQLQGNQEKTLTMDNTYPFEVTDQDGKYTIVAPLESEELFTNYYPLFEKYDYEGNGYCWEGHIVQILEKEDAELLDHLQFDPEAGAFFAYADSKEAQVRFINLVSPIFADLAQLEEYIKSADPDRVDE